MSSVLTLDDTFTVRKPICARVLILYAEIKILNSKVLIYSEGNSKKSRAADIKVFKIDQRRYITLAFSGHFKCGIYFF